MNAQASINTMIYVDNGESIRATICRISLLSTLVVSSLPKSPSANLIKKTSAIITDASNELAGWFEESNIQTSFMRNATAITEKIRFISVLVTYSAPLNLSKKMLEKAFSQIRAMSDAMLDELDTEEVLV